MAIFFNIPEVRAQLLEHGFVYTLRPFRREGRDVAVEGSRYSYTIFADVNVEYVKVVHKAGYLINYVSRSGMNTSTEWFNKAKSFYPIGTQLHLYKVTLLRRRVIL